MRRWIPALAAAALLGALSPALWADTLADARKAVDGSDYPSGKTLLAQALEAGTAGPEELAEIYKLTGICEGALGNTKASSDAFAKWLSLDPKGNLPFGTSPKITRPFTTAQEHVKKVGAVSAKAETEDDPPSVTLVVANDPQKLVVGAKVYFRVDKHAEQTLASEGTGSIKIELEVGKRIDLRLHAVDKYGNRVIELGSKDVPIVITSSGATTPLVDPNHAAIAKPQPVHAEPAAPRPWYAQWWVWGITTAVATGAGGYFAWRTREDIHELDELNANSLAHPWSDAQAVESRGRRDLLATNIAAGAAGVFALGTLILLFTRPDTSESASPVTVAPAAGGGVIGYGGRF